MTSAPCALAICTANVPTPPEAPLTRTFCPGWSPPVVAQPWSTVSAATGTAAASSTSGSPASARLPSGTQTYSANDPRRLVPPRRRHPAWRSVRPCRPFPRVPAKSAAGAAGPLGLRGPVTGRAIHGVPIDVVPVHRVHRSGAHPHEDAVVARARALASWRVAAGAERAVPVADERLTRPLRRCRRRRRGPPRAAYSRRRGARRSSAQWPTGDGVETLSRDRICAPPSSPPWRGHRRRPDEARPGAGFAAMSLFSFVAYGDDVLDGVIEIVLAAIRLARQATGKPPGSDGAGSVRCSRRRHGGRARRGVAARRWRLHPRATATLAVSVVGFFLPGPTALYARLAAPVRSRVAPGGFQPTRAEERELRRLLRRRSVGRRPADSRSCARSRSRRWSRPGVQRGRAELALSVAAYARATRPSSSSSRRPSTAAGAPARARPKLTQALTRAGR